MIEFRNEKSRKISVTYKGYPAKAHDKDERIFSPICTIKTDINDNMTYDNSEDCPWPKGTICIAGDSIVSGFIQACYSINAKLK